MPWYTKYSLFGYHVLAKTLQLLTDQPSYSSKTKLQPVKAGFKNISPHAGPVGYWALSEPVLGVLPQECGLIFQTSA